MRLLCMCMLEAVGWMCKSFWGWRCRIVKLVRALRKGWIKTTAERMVSQEEAEAYLLWEDDGLISSKTPHGEPCQTLLSAQSCENGGNLNFFIMASHLTVSGSCRVVLPASNKNASPWPCRVVQPAQRIPSHRGENKTHCVAHVPSWKSWAHSSGQEVFCHACSRSPRQLWQQPAERLSASGGLMRLPGVVAGGAQGVGVGG